MARQTTSRFEVLVYSFTLATVFAFGGAVSVGVSTTLGTSAVIGQALLLLSTVFLFGGVALVFLFSRF